MLRLLERVLLLVVLVVFAATASAFAFTVDDAYISMRYARHLAEGAGLVYNLGEYVEGYTNPVWVVLLAGAYSLGFNLVTSAFVLGVASSLLTLVLVYQLTSELLPRSKALTRIFPVVFLASNWIYVGWATGGLETSLFGCLAMVCLFLFRRCLDRPRTGALLPLACLLLTLTRPEGLLLSGVLFVSTTWNKRDGASRRENWWWWALFLACPLALHTLWRLYYYGDWLPNTFHVKVSRFQYVERGWIFFSSFAKDSLLYAWGPAILIPLVSLNPVTWSVVGYALLYIVYTIWIGGDWMGYRFFHHLLPLMSIPVAQTVESGVTYITSRRFRTLRRTLAAPSYKTATCLAAAAVVVATIATAYKTYHEGRKTRLAFAELLNYDALDLPEWNAIEVARGLETVLAPGEAASATFAGFTAVYTDLPIVDSLGLNDKYVARLPPVVRGTPGHEKFAPKEYLIARNVVVVNPWPRTEPGDANTVLAVRYAPGAYLHFDVVEPASLVVQRLQSRGFDVWAGGEPLLNPARFERASLALHFDFEDGTWRDWQLTGGAFGESPRQGSDWLNVPQITGLEGHHFVNTYFGNSDEATGTARSREFEIVGNVISFLIAGGKSTRTALELWIDGRMVRRSSGTNSEQLLRRMWIVEEFRGRTGYLLIRDDESGPWGHIVVDDIQVGDLRKGG
jgi:arabinofuranosyltransferase